MFVSAVAAEDEGRQHRRSHHHHPSIALHCIEGCRHRSAVVFQFPISGFSELCVRLCLADLIRHRL